MSEYTTPQFGPSLHSETVSWVCGNCGRGNERSRKRPPLKDGDRFFGCGYCGAEIEDPGVDDD